MGTIPATRELPCPIADKSVRAVLRRGGLLGGPPTMHVHCSEAACQYVDANEPPCPLSVGLFEGPSDRMVAERVTGQGEPTCLECIAHALGVTHDEVRRGLWPLADQALVRVRPGRCRTCGRRRVVVHAVRPRAARPAPVPPVPLGPGAPETVHRMLTCLVDTDGAPCCPACLALAAGASLQEVRQALATGGALRQHVVDGGECSSCGRQQTLLAAWPKRDPPG